MDFLYVTGGTLAPDAPSYVERGADRDLLDHLLAGETCYVLNSRQMGKSSLCVRTIDKLREQGVRTAFLDLTKFGGRNLTAEQWYAALLSEMGRDLGLRPEFLAYWKANSDLPPVQRVFGALVEFGLTGEAPVVVFIDEIDVTLSLPFSADEFFAAIRQCYVGRATDERLKRLSFCLLGTATPADLMQDTRVSPFNIGKRIELRDFTPTEAAPLAAGLGDPKLLDRVLYWTGGHPYLTQRLCQAVYDSGSKNVDQVCSDLFLTHSAKESDDNLAFVRNRLLKSEADLAALLDLYRKLRTGKRIPDDETNPLCALLKLSGVAKVEGGNLKVRNRIYAHVFDREWVETHMLDAEKRRQKEAYRKGLFRAAALGSVVVVAIGFLAWIALKSRLQLQEQLYQADLSAAGVALEHGDIRTAKSLLLSHVAQRGQADLRGFEWRLLWDRCQDQSSLTLKGFQGVAYFSMFSPDGNILVAGGSGEHANFRIWRLGNREQVATWLEGGKSIASGAFSFNGQIFATGSNDTVIRLHKTSDWSLVGSLKGHTEGVRSLTFVKSRDKLVSAGWDKKLCLWDTRTMALVKQRQFPSAALAPESETSHDGSTIATFGGDDAVQLWSTETLEPLGKPIVSESTVSFIKFSADDQKIAIVGLDNVIRIWNIESGRKDNELRPTELAESVAFDKSGKYLFVGEFRGSIAMFDLDSASLVNRLLGHDRLVTSLTMSPNGKQLVSSGADGYIRVWNVGEFSSSPDWYSVVDNASDQALTVRITPDQKEVVRGRQAGFDVFDVRTGSRKRMIRFSPKLESTRIQNPMGFSHDGKQLLLCDWSSKNLLLAAYDTNGQYDVLRNTRGAIVTAALSPDGKTIAGATFDNAICLWNASTKAVDGYIELDTWCNYIQFLPGTEDLAVALADGSVRIISIKSRQEIHRVAANLDQVAVIAFSRYGNLMATSGTYGDPSVKVWDTQTFKQVGRNFDGFQGNILSLSFDPEGHYLYGTNQEGRIFSWSIAKHREVLSFRSGCAVTVCTQDGQALVTNVVYGPQNDKLLIWRPRSLAEIEGSEGFRTEAKR